MPILTSCKSRHSPGVFSTARRSREPTSKMAWRPCGRWSPLRVPWNRETALRWSRSQEACKTTMMQLGIFAKTFVRPTLAETLDAVVAHGLQFTQFNMACAGLPSMPDHLDPDTVALIRQAFDSRNLTMAAVSGTF